MKQISKTAKLSVATLAIMNVTAVVSLRGLPAEAEYGLSSAFYYLFAAIVFLIPTALVAAELAAMFADKQGGVFRWVGEAFGKRMGFLAIWLQWVESTIWYPTVLTFGAVSLAFIGMNDAHDMSLASNRLYTLVVVLAIYWLATFISLKGMSWVGKVSKIGGLVGTIIPAGLLVVLAIVYLVSGGHSQLDFKGDFFPDFSNFNNLVLAASIFLFYAGMEMSAVHVNDVQNPRRDFPLAIGMASVITVCIFVFGTLAIGFIIPKGQINLVQSLLVAYDKLFDWMGMPWLGSVLAICLAFGVLAQVVAWVGGPSKGLLQVGCAGYLPRFMQRTNKAGVQVGILLIQGAVVTLLSVFFVLLPSVQSAYQMISQLTIILYLLMYMLMFAAAIYLRYSEPSVPRSFRIPGGKSFGMWVVAGVGLIGSLLAFVFSFIPPGQIEVGSPALYVTLLVFGTLIFTGIPFIIYAVRKPEWKRADVDFEPFGRDATQTK